MKSCPAFRAKSPPPRQRMANRSNETHKVSSRASRRTRRQEANPPLPRGTRFSRQRTRPMNRPTRLQSSSCRRCLPFSKTARLSETFCVYKCELRFAFLLLEPDVLRSVEPRRRAETKHFKQGRNEPTHCNGRPI